MGDRIGLWKESLEAGQRRNRARRGAQSEEQLQREVERLVSLGRVGEAANRLTSPGLAAENPQVRSKLLAKFPPAVGEPITDEGIGPPPEIPLEVIREAIFSGRRGAGPGPDGIRGDFLRDIMGFESDQEPIGKVIQAFIQLLADGNVPTYLRPFLGGGWDR